MATTVVYGKVIASLFNKEIDYDTDTIKVALVTSSYTPNQDTHDYFDDVVSNEASGTGYTAGGATLASKTITYDGGTNKMTLDAADVSWAASSITARYAVVYDASPGTDATRPLLAYVDFGSNQSSSSGTFTVSWSASGIVSFTMAV
jgi:hypothetical protein